MKKICLLALTLLICIPLAVSCGPAKPEEEITVPVQTGSGTEEPLTGRPKSTGDVTTAQTPGTTEAPTAEPTPVTTPAATPEQTTEKTPIELPVI